MDESPAASSHSAPLSVHGVGCDIIEIDRIASAIQKHPTSFLKRHFTEKENAYFSKYKNPTPHVAGRFAAKEAIAKALSLGIGADLDWLDMEILNDERGKPMATLSSTFTASQRVQNSKQIYSIEVSISHAKKYAVAFAICMNG